jgi:hypothetical protein
MGTCEALNAQPRMASVENIPTFKFNFQRSIDHVWHDFDTPRDVLILSTA